MPPRYVYWTILAGGLPTAFRAAEREELLPTFKQIQQKHPDAEMKYFARGKLWNSPAEARAARDAPPPGERRNREWRPGGEHRDPRQKFKDAKKDRNQRWRKERHEHREGRDERAKGAFEARGPRKPHGDPMRKPAGKPAGRAFPAGPADRKGAPPHRAFKPRGAFTPRGDFKSRSEFKKDGGRPFKPRGAVTPKGAFEPRPEFRKPAAYKTRWQIENEKKDDRKKGRRRS